MGKKTPKTPDVVGAAQKEGEFSREAARDELYANRPDQYNAFGSNTWQQSNVRDPATGEMTTKWTQRQNLSPEMQTLFDQQQYTNQQLGNTAASMTGRVNADLATPADWGQFGDVIGGPQSAGPVGGNVAPTTGPEGFEWDGVSRRQAAEDASYGRQTSRLDPQFEQDRQALEVRLRNRGLRAGDQGYESEMASFGRDRTDAYEQARMGSTLEGRAEDMQAYGQASDAWGQNLNTQQQRYQQQLGSAGNRRQADQQSFSQEMQATERANALRKQQIEEYAAKRGQSLDELNRLRGSQNLGDMTETFGSA